jgi:Raf kinase inhibitor-like YbhB/YbcL family protein
MHIRWFMLLVLFLSVFVFFGGCTSTTSPSDAQSPSGSSQPAQSDPLVQSAASSGLLTLRVDSLSPGSILPDVYTCKGTMESPKVSWSGIPAGTKSLVLILEDPDAPDGLYTHWLVYNIPPRDGELAQGQANAKVLSNGAPQGESSNGFRGYYPPAHPSDQRTMIFSVFMRLTCISLFPMQTGPQSIRPWPVRLLQRPNL